MAIRYAVQTGNWSDTTTWDGGTIPGAGDDVYADGFTVTIDIIEITVSSLNNGQRPGGTDGGGFNTTTNGARVYTCDINASPTTPTRCLTLGINNSNLQTFIGNITAGAQDAIYNSATSGYTTIITGNCQASTGYAFRGRSDRPHYLTVIGNVYGSSSQRALYTSNSYINGRVTVIGNVFGNGVYTGGTALITGNIDCSNIDKSGVYAGVKGRVNGVLTNSINGNCVDAPTLYLEESGSLEFNIVEEISGNVVNLRSPISGGNYPVENDVRSGTVYGSVNEFSGSLSVPNSSSVAVGVPVDNTTGTAIITITDMGALLASYDV